MTNWNKFDETAENENLSKKRLEICEECPHIRHHKILPTTCGICGCILSIKTMFKGQHCPDKPPKW
jgi:hypothetical protein